MAGRVTVYEPLFEVFEVNYNKYTELATVPLYNRTVVEAETDWLEVHYTVTLEPARRVVVGVGYTPLM